MDLARKILFAMEASEKGLAPRISIDGYSPEEIGYHVWLLADGGLINATEVTHNLSRSREAIPVSLTWAGHEFIDAARSDTVWRKAKEKAQSSGVEMSFALMKQVLIAVAKAQLAQHGVHIP